MKIGAVICTRNDNYGGNLNERATYCLNSMIDTLDQVILVDWNSPTHALLYDIQQNINFKGNLKHIVISPEIASILTNNDINAQKCCEVLSRNLGIRRLINDMDWVISTNIDIIAPKRKDLENRIKELDDNTFYTISRRDTELSIIKDFHMSDKCNFDEWKLLRDYLIENSQPRHREEKTVDGDDYSLINCLS